MEPASWARPATPTVIVHARLLDLVAGRSGKTTPTGPKNAADFTSGIRTAALDPFRGYANAIRPRVPQTR
jgi:transposase